MKPWMKYLAVIVGVPCMVFALAITAMSVTTEQTGISGKQVYSYDTVTGLARMQVVISDILVQIGGEHIGATEEEGYIRVQPRAGSLGGASTLSYISAGATEDEHAICTAACTLYSISATNTNAAVRYLKCENDIVSGTAPGTDTPELRFAITGQAIGGVNNPINSAVGLAFSTGLTCWLVTGAADSDVAEVAANELMVNYGFKQ